VRAVHLSLTLGALSAGQILFGFLATLYVLFEVGPGPETDALIAAQTVPVLVVAIIGTSLVNILVPIFASLPGSQLRQITWAVLVWTLAVFAGGGLILGLLAPYWSSVLFPGFSAATTHLTVQLVHVQFLGMTFAGLNAVLTALYRVEGRFVQAEIYPTLLTGLSLAALFFLVPLYGVHAAAWAWTLRLGLQTVAMLPGAGKPSASELRSASVRSVWARLRPLIIGSSVYKLAPLVDRYFASTAAAGAISLLNVASQLCSSGAMIIERAVITPVIPGLTHAFQRGDFQGFLRRYRRRMWVSAALVLGAMSALVAIFPFLERFIVAHAWVTSEQLELLYKLTLLLTGAAVTMAAGPIMVAGFYATGDSVTPALLGVTGIAVSVVLKYIGFNAGGMEGLVLATSTYYLGNLVVGSVLLERKIARARKKPH
jgi:putative peptidoglycan lipid II flippase